MNFGRIMALSLRHSFWTLSKSSHAAHRSYWRSAFGNGDSLVQLASEDESSDFLGIEVHDPGIGHCMIAARAAAVENLRIIAHDAIEVLEHQIAAAHWRASTCISPIHGQKSGTTSDVLYSLRFSSYAPAACNQRLRCILRQTGRTMRNTLMKF